jgi:hypothetical protein
LLTRPPPRRSTASSYRRPRKATSRTFPMAWQPSSVHIAKANGCRTDEEEGFCLAPSLDGLDRDGSGPGRTACLHDRFFAGACRSRHPVRTLVATPVKRAAKAVPGEARWSPTYSATQGARTPAHRSAPAEFWMYYGAEPFELAPHPGSKARSFAGYPLDHQQPLV